MHIGLIGGIGPSATVAYYTRLVTEFKRADLPLELTIVHADIALLAANAGGDARQSQADVFAKHLGQLERAGCDVALITALTGHFCFEETKALSPLPLLNGIEVVDSYCNAHNIKKLGILGSPPVLKTRLFGLLNYPQVVVPSGDLEVLGQAYLEVATSGICTPENRVKFFDTGSSMTADHQTDAILLAGTDLGLVFDGQAPGFPVIDALDLHVRALVEMALREHTK